MIHPLRILVAVVGVSAGMMFGPSHAEAAFTCNQNNLLGTPVYHTLGATLDVTWQDHCDGASWKVDLYVQYKVNGSWFDAGCVNTNPCHIRRPSATDEWYTAGSSKGGSVSFAVRNQCVTYRVRLYATSFGGTQLGPYPSPQSVCQ